MRRLPAALLIAAPLLAAPRPALGSEAVEEGRALAWGLSGTFVPLAAGGLVIGIGMAVDDRVFFSAFTAAGALAMFGFAVGPAMAYGYMGRRIYAAVSSVAKIGIVTLGVGQIFMHSMGMMLFLTAFLPAMAASAVVELALIRHVARRSAGRIETAISPWAGPAGGGLALTGRF
jgi:hypothetical protein